MNSNRIEGTRSILSVKCIVSLVMGVILMFSIFGCNKTGKDPKTTEPSVTYATPEECMVYENRLFCYYEAVVATQGGDESFSYSLYGYTDTEMVLAWNKTYTDGQKSSDYRLVPATVLDDCLKIAKKYKFGKGKWLNGSGITGMVYSIDYLKDGEHIRVSSESMPDNGMDAFDAVEKVLSNAWKQA